MRQSDRFRLILDRIARDGSVGVASIAKELGASEATVRRDLVRLEEQHLVARTHGGAVALGVLYELPLRYRGARHEQQKRRIAQAAAQLVQSELAVGLTGGTTTTEIARELVDHQRLTVVTNALNIAAELAVRPNIKLVVTGGVARPESYELVGPLAEATLSDVNLDVVFVGTDGLSVQAGLTTHHEVEAHTDRALIAHAHKVVVVTDSSKIGRTSFARICPIEQVDELITDDGADVDEIARLRDAGVSVKLV